MANHNLTDLLPDWHPLPAGGGLIRKDERYAVVEADGRVITIYTSHTDWSTPADDRILTEHPITPPLPTEDGATILVSSDERPPSVLLMREAGRWVNSHGVEWYNNEIHAWAPVTLGETVVMP